MAQVFEPHMEHGQARQRPGASWRGSAPVMGRRSSAEEIMSIRRSLESTQRSEDQRFEGQIVRYLPDKGYGFIRCQELRQSRYPDRDIFLHQKQLGNLKEGDAVSFGILLNRDGKPTATELAYLNGGGQQQQQQPQQYQQQYDQQYQQQYSQQYQQQPQQQQQYEQQYQQQYQQYPPQYQQQSQDHYGMQGMQAFGGQEQAAAWEPQDGALFSDEML
eukprot:g16769.t1